jgi:glycosyltransferase involved in cell wall biosynthesis
LPRANPVLPTVVGTDLDPVGARQEDSPVRIAHVTDFYLPRLGGIEMHVHDLAVRQQAAGHRVEVLTSTPGGPDDVPVRRVTEGFRRPGAMHPAAPRLVGGLLRAGRYDVVHIHVGVLSPLSFAAVAAAAGAGCPVVVTLHSLLSPYGPAFRALDAVTGWSDWPVQWTAVSDVAAGAIRALVGPHRPVLVLPNGIDAARWRIERSPRDPGRVVVAGVMRLAARKRPLPLLRMLRRARAQLPSTVDLRAVVVGEGRQRPVLERYLRRHRMTGWVELPGRLPRAEIRRLFERTDLFVAPAVLESFGIAALEARCAGLPVLARSGCGIGTFVRHERDGLLAADDEQMTRDLVRLAADPRERERLAAASRLSPPDLGWTSVLQRTTDAYAAAERLARPSGRPTVLGAAG